MMSVQRMCVALLAFALITPLIAAQESLELRSKDPIVKAVQKTIAGVVAIRVPRQGEKDMIGSGLIVDESGLIVTNRHVTGGKKQVKVRLNDGTDLVGDVIVADADLDLAVVRVKSQKPLHVLRLLADKNDLLLAEKVIAIGSPYGYEGTVSVGIISALNREVYMPNEYLMTGLIQHNAAINPGNSGGPLVNVNGEVIGVNVAMRDGAQNIAFAINAGTVKDFLNKNLSAKRVAGVEHGIKCTEKIIAEMGDRQRVVVKNASHDELKAGDEIITVGELKVGNTFDVERALWQTKPGQKVDVKLMRQGKELAVTLTLAASQGAGQVASVSPETPASTNATATQIGRPTSER